MESRPVLQSMHRERLSLFVANKRHVLPEWADWLVWLGQWLRVQTRLPGRRIVVARMPTRRLSAAFVGLGTVLAGVQAHDDSLEWESLRQLPEGTLVHWRDHHGVKHTGRVGRVREDAGRVYLAIEVDTPKRRKGTFLLPKETALSYGVTLGTITVRGEQQMTSAAEFLRAAVHKDPLAWMRSPGSEGTLVTERASFLADLGNLRVATGAARSVPMLDALTIPEDSLKQYGKLRLLPARADSFVDSERGVTILDGAVAAVRLTSSLAHSIVILLDQAEYDEEVVNVLAPFAGNSVDGGIHPPPEGMPATPRGIEAFAIGLPENGAAR